MEKKENKLKMKMKMMKNKQKRYPTMGIQDSGGQYIDFHDNRNRENTKIVIEDIR